MWNQPTPTMDRMGTGNSLTEIESMWDTILKYNTLASVFPEHLYIEASVHHTVVWLFLCLLVFFGKDKGIKLKILCLSGKCLCH